MHVRRDSQDIEVLIVAPPYASGASILSAYDDLFAVGRRLYSLGKDRRAPVGFRVRTAGDPVSLAGGIEFHP